MTLPPGDDLTPEDEGSEEAAAYIKSAAKDLSRVARRHGHEMLAYLLDMAHLEAENILRPRAMPKRSGH